MTKIAISSTGNNVDSIIDPRFTRCSYFVIVDTETMDSTAVPNPSAHVAGCAGIDAAHAVLAEEVNAVVTGHIGPHAMAALSAAGKRVLSANPGTVRQAIDAFTRGDLMPITDAAQAFGGARMRVGMGHQGHGYGRGGHWS